MANGEWLTQLMAGLGGAFTGATQAKSRMAEEAEAERKQMELENERARLKRIQELRGGGFSEASARELLSLGETPGNVESLRELFTPKAKPTYEERKEQGGTAIYKDGQFSGWKYKPPTERETPAGPTAADKRAAETEYRTAVADVQRMIRGQPKLSDVRYQGITPSAARDTASFLRDREAFAADTAFGMARARAAAQNREQTTGLQSILPGQKPPMPQTASAELVEARAAQQAIARVMASGISDDDKQARVRAITDELNRAITEIRSGR